MNPETLDDACVALYDKIVDRDKQWLMSNSNIPLNLTDKIIRAKENVQREVIKKISKTN